MYNSRLTLRINSADKNVTGQKMADTAKDGLLLGGGICHITATQVEVKKFLLAYLIFLTR